MSSLGEEYPKEQARCGEILQHAIEVGKLPKANTTFMVLTMKDMLRRADEAAISGDLVQMIRCFEEMKECDE